MKENPNPRRMLFLFSDTGGGHRSAAEAIIEALQIEYGRRVKTTMVDFFKDYAPPPLDRFPEWYPSMVKVPQAWGLGYRLSDGHHRAHLITSTSWPYVRRAAIKLVKNYPSDCIVSVHPFASAPILSALGQNRPPFVTVVTDLVTTHAFWYHQRTDLCIVPTEPARQKALASGLRPDQVRVVGLPVADRFCKPSGDVSTLRHEVGWPQDLPVVILVGGGDGLGPLKPTAEAIANSGCKLTLVVITGRNQSLRNELEKRTWPIPTFIYGFVNEMPEFMQAADILVTKAGPGTISEALNAGLPMIMYSYLPGQEEGNVNYVQSMGAGIWAPEPDQIVAALRKWILDPDSRQKAVEACHRLARPQAAREIAHILAKITGV